MAAVLFLLAIGAALVGADLVRNPLLAHEAFITFLGAAVFLAGSFIVNAVDRSSRELSRLVKMLGSRPAGIRHDSVADNLAEMNATTRR